MDKPHYDPLAELSAVRDVFTELAERGFLDPRKTPPAALASLLVPLDILDTGAQLVIQANMPGIEADGLRIEIKGEMLVMTAEVKPDPEMQGAVYLRRERQLTKLSRSVPLPVPVETAQADASFHNGILTIRLPKLAKIVPKSIKVTVS